MLHYSINAAPQFLYKLTAFPQDISLVPQAPHHSGVAKSVVAPN